MYRFLQAGGCQARPSRAHSRVSSAAEWAREAAAVAVAVYEDLELWVAPFGFSGLDVHQVDVVSWWFIYDG